MKLQKWIAVIGSPRRGRNTEKLVDIIINVLKEKNISVEKYYLDRAQMSPCINCEYCIEAGQCHINDDISNILNEIKMSDGVILAGPSYNYNVTAQMKVLLDRTFSLNDFTGSVWRSRVGDGKKAIVVGNCKGSSKESMGYNTEAMRKVLDELEIEVLDVIEYFDTKFTPVGENMSKINCIEDRVRKSEVL
ncbi:flavodoxin family protein [Fusibacter ferrireducens]|uniref:Flavodoxin family protein n=1 Tax=Fusibacter ferrireducens TaxID=2785058 RepID=A0ABR9ZNP6_9FIRM|nr:flavodoxin family protein [Fusibacter ferrireducens]MBF4692066.1 flavodoxin family protein [Fusibacter ferrireducens]